MTDPLFPHQHELPDGRLVALGRPASSPETSDDLHLHQFLKAPRQLPQPPASNDYIPVVPGGFSASMFGNDAVGDCVFASSGHRTMVQSAMSKAFILPTTAAILAAYSAVTGYNPNDPSTDNGAMEIEAANWERRHDLFGARIFAFARVNPKDQHLMRMCSYYFGGVWLGIGLPMTAQEQVGRVWDVTDPSGAGDAAIGSWGGHAVFAPTYDPDTLTCITWAAEQRMTNAFVTMYVDEAWCIIPSEWQGEKDPFKALNWNDLRSAVGRFGPMNPMY